ncbi:MAG: hypothetical protein NTY76_01700, partial [Candidatus Omnitrophica bacterium]|nr:hypothetical protein [Candidatus Omnitrophota bacterium]
MTHNITWYSFSTLFGAVASLSLSYFVYKNIKKGSPDIYYAAILVCMAIWCFDSFLVSMLPYDKSVLFIARICHLGGIYSSYFFVQWVFGIVNNKSSVAYKAYLVFSTLVAVFLTVLNFSSDLLIKLIDNQHFFIPFHSGGSFYHVFAMFLFLNGAIGCGELFRNIKITTGSKKIQLAYILMATLVMYVAGITYYLFVQGIKIWPVADIFVAFSSFVITYAIVRHNLMDIKIIIKRTLVFAGLLTSVLTILILPTLILQEYLFRNAAITARLIGLAISGIIIIFTMRRTEDFLINITDKYLFQKKYDYKELLKTFTSEVLTV